MDDLMLSTYFRLDNIDLSFYTLIVCRVENSAELYMIPLRTRQLYSSLKLMLKFYY